MTDNQPENTQEGKKLKEAPLLPFMWKKGQSGNPKGRPKGRTMKEYARELLECQTEEERQEFLHGLPKEVIWKMAEGNPETRSEVKQETTLNPILVKFLDKKDDETSDNGNTE